MLVVVERMIRLPGMSCPSLGLRGSWTIKGGGSDEDVVGIGDDDGEDDGLKGGIGEGDLELGRLELLA